MRITTRFDNATNEYVLDIEWPDARRDTERYSDNAEFAKRVQALQADLGKNDWTASGSAVIQDGWRGPSSRH